MNLLSQTAVCGNTFTTQIFINWHYVYINIYMHILLYICIYILCVYTYRYMCTYIYIYIYVCVCLRLYVLWCVGHTEHLFLSRTALGLRTCTSRRRTCANRQRTYATSSSHRNAFTFWKWMLAMWVKTNGTRIRQTWVCSTAVCHWIWMRIQVCFDIGPFETGVLLISVG